MRSRSQRVSALAVLMLGLGVACLSPRGAAAQPCASGADVRNLDDSAVPSTIKAQIFSTPGNIINTKNKSFPSGKLVVIRAAFKDFSPNTAATTAYVDGIFYGDGSGQKNIAGYYKSNSYGKLSVTKAATPDWITLNQTLGSFSPGIEGNAAFVQAVLKLAKVNWLALDANANKAIDASEAQIIILVPTMPTIGFASTRSVAVGTAATPGGTLNFGTRNIIIFSLKGLTDPQFDVNPIRSLPTVAHELGHAFFNLPDRYGSNTGTGEYDMMGSASSSTWVGFTMPDRIRIGWIQPKIVREHQDLCMQFVASELQPAALILVPIDQFLDNPLEFWVVENRHKAYNDGGYDDDLPDGGLAIWYVSVGTAPGGFDDVRLVDFSQPDQTPTLYNNPGTNALFTENDADPRRIILDRNGHWNLLWFENISDKNAGISPGLFMFGSF